MNKKYIEFLKPYILAQERMIEDQRNRLDELNKIIDTAQFNKTEFVHINKTTNNDLVFYNLEVSVINPIRRTFRTSKINLIPEGRNINKSQPTIKILSTKSNDKYILINIEIIDKQIHYERTYLYNKDTYLMKFISPQELNLYKE